MNPQNLESLLIDRALGELSPAVAELLEAYVASDPAAARRAAEFRSTVNLARNAVAQPPASLSRPLDLIRLQRARETSAATARRSELYRLAACLALGAGLGWFTRPTSPPAPSTAAVSPSLVQRFNTTATASTEPRSTFWSVARLSDGRLSPRPSANPFHSSLR